MRALGVAALVGCSGEPPATWCAVGGEAFGTTWTAKWRAPDGVCDDQAVGGAAGDALAEVDRQMSTWRDDSELSAVRRGPGPVPVSRDTAEVVRSALALAEVTGGAFDPTVQPLMEVWGFHAREGVTEPGPEALSAARALVGFRRVTVSEEPDGPRVDAGGAALDLSAIAKGHGVDRVFTALSRRGIGDLMIEVGGEVRVGGSGPAGLWRLGVDAPVEGNAPGAELAARIGFTNAAMATSGNYRNLVDLGGRRVHHTMDPRTGAPAQTDVASVTVIGPDCRLADGLATAVMVLGADAGLSLLEGWGDVEGLVLVAEPDGFVHRRTSGMAALLD